MAQANLRLAAGAVVVAVSFVVVGPCAAVALASPGRGHSGHSDNNNSDNNRGSNSSSGGSRNGSDYSDTINSRSGSTTDSRPSSRVGSGRESGTSDERPSSDYSPDTPGQSRAPKVTFGDGRSPGVQDHDSGPRWGWSAPEAPAPPPPPQVITVPLNPPTVSPAPPHPGMVQQLVVAPTAGIADPIWGVAGLLLIPAAGAILGYRQARGAHAASELGRRA